MIEITERASRTLMVAVELSFHPDGSGSAWSKWFRSCPEKIGLVADDGISEP